MLPKRWLERSPTLTNLQDDHEFVNEEYIFIHTRSFGKSQNKAMNRYAQSGQYHTIVESRES